MTLQTDTTTHPTKGETGYRTKDGLMYLGQIGSGHYYTPWSGEGLMTISDAERRIGKHNSGAGLHGVRDWQLITTEESDAKEVKALFNDNKALFKDLATLEEIHPHDPILMLVKTKESKYMTVDSRTGVTARLSKDSNQTCYVRLICYSNSLI